LPAVLSACGPTYPKESLKNSIVKICKKEYNLDVKVETAGKTIAIYFPVEGLIDPTLTALGKAAGEKLNDIILSVSRVAISTDAKYDIYCIIAHDVKLPEVQVVIIKSVDDVKRFMLNDISRDEYSKRMLFDLRLNSQAQKEYKVKAAFEQRGLDKKWEDVVMDEFFSAAPTNLADIGYWAGKFYIKDISIAEFLAEQVASRVKIEFKEDKSLADKLMVRSASGEYKDDSGVKFFRFEVAAIPKILVTLGDEDIPATVFRVTAKVAAGVLHGYGFEDFKYIEIINSEDSQALKISREDLEKLRTKKLKFEDVLR
jgi:hypothetical protein